MWYWFSDLIQVTRCVRNSAPNRVACKKSALPELLSAESSRETQVVLDARARSSLSARRLGLDHQGPQTLGCAIHSSRQPRRSRPDHHHVIKLLLRLRPQSHLRGQLGRRGLHQRRPIPKQHHWQLGIVDTLLLQQCRGLRRPLRIQPLVRYAVARQEIPHRMVGRRPPHPDHPHSLERRLIPLFPSLHQVVEHRVKLLLRRIPWLIEVIVNLGRVDRADRRLGIRIGRQQNPLCLWKQHHRLLQQLHTVHTGHPLVGEEKRNRVAALLQLPADIERRQAGSCPKNTVVLPVLTPQVLHDSLKYADVVVDREQNGLGHNSIYT